MEPAYDITANMAINTAQVAATAEEKKELSIYRPKFPFHSMAT